MEVKGLVKTYGDLTAVDGIDFQVLPGEILGILGPNGSGKTTTLKSILGLVAFDRGSIRVNGLPVPGQTRRVLERTGAVLEGARNIYWYLSPRENLAYYAGIRGLSRSSVAPRIEALLEGLALDDVADKEVRQFSSGMKQKCALACAFIHDPDLLLLDEPTLGLDVETGRMIRNWLRNMVRNRGKTILITSHDMDFIESVCDRVLIVRKGRIVSHETVFTLREKFAGKFFAVELDRPPSPELLESLSTWGRVSHQGSSLKVELASLGNLAPMVAALAAFPGKLLDFRTVENDLEEIFLQMIREGDDAHP